MTEKERMLSGKLYYAGDPELVADHARRDRLLQIINAPGADRPTVRAALRELLGHVGERFWFQPPFFCDYGSHISIGENFYANFDCIILDVCDVTIGDNVLLAPRVCIFTASHPIDAGVRDSGLENGRPVKIGSSVWIGGGSIINPGVTIGDNTVIGSGSVVTRNIPSGVVAAGNPCRVLRTITQADKDFWEAQAAEYHAQHP